MDQIFKDITEILSDEEGTISSVIDHKILWESLLHLAETQVRYLGQRFSLLLSYSDRFPDFKVAQQCIIDRIEKVSNVEQTFEERSKLVSPLIVLAPFLPKEIYIKTIKNSIDINHGLILQKNELTFDFLDVFDDFLADDMDPAILSSLFEEYKLELTGEKAAAAICCLAPISPEVAEIIEGTSEYIINIALEGLDKNGLVVEASCFLLEYLCVFFEHSPDALQKPDDLFIKLINLMTGSSKSLTKRAYKSFKALMECQIFIDEHYLIDLLGKFSLFTSQVHLKYYYKILISFVSPEDSEEEEFEPQISIIQPIFDFCVKNIKESQDIYIKAHSLDLLAEIGAIDPMYIEEIYQEGLTIAKDIIESGKSDVFSYLGAYILTLFNSFQDSTKDIIKEFVPKLISSVKNDLQIPLKERLLVATDCAALLGQGLNDSFVQELTQYSLDSLKSEDKKASFTACAILYHLRPKLSNENAKLAFEIIGEKTLLIDDEEGTELYFQTMRKIMKLFPINEELLNRLLLSILEGTLPIFKGSKPYLIEPPHEFIFQFLSGYIKKYPIKSSELCQKIIDWLPLTSTHSWASLLTPLNTGLTVSAIKEEDARKLSKSLEDYIQKIDIDEINELIISVDILRLIFTSYPNAIESIDTYFVKFEEFINIIKENGEEEDSEEALELLPAMPSIAQFVFTVYSNNENIPINENLLLSLVQMMPFEPGVALNELISLLISILDDYEKFESIVLPSLKMFSELLLLKKSELDEYNIEQDVNKSMKDSLKTIIKYKPSY